MRMSGVVLIMACLTMLVICFPACNTNDERAPVIVNNKQGDSCLVDHKCKITVRRWEGRSSMDQRSGANVYYRCLVRDEFYNVVSPEQAVQINLSNGCERINP